MLTFKKVLNYASVLINNSFNKNKVTNKMKKLLFAFVALAAMSFASCGNAEKGTANDSDTVVAGDTLQNDTTVATDTTVAADTTVKA